MELRVRVEGIDQAQARLKAVGRRVDPVLRGAINSTATKARAERYVKRMKDTIPPKRTRGAIRISRARRNQMSALIVPSGAGVPVVYYKTWGFVAIDATRARIWVRGPMGRKTAAGFVNPSSQNKLPLQTRSYKKSKSGKEYSYKRNLQLALAPSVAYWFKQLTNNQTRRWVENYLAAEFSKRIQKELDKA